MRVQENWQEERDSYMASYLFRFGIKKTPSQEGINTLQPPREADSLSLSDEVFAELRDLIYSKCGIYYNDAKKYLLESRIAKRALANKLDSFEKYVELLRSNDAQEELQALFESITINETYFFRANQQFEAFENVIVPQLVKQKLANGSKSIRIWSAACSSGEEPYSLALIYAERLRHKYPDIKFQLYASDINNGMLDSARRGVYKEYAVRNVPSEIMQKYFVQKGNVYALSDDIKKLVKFSNINLYDSNFMRNITGMDVIFCANVLIYFDVPSKQLVVSSLYNSLNPGGFLFIGYSESLHGISKAFKLIHLPKSLAYQKE